MLQAIAKVLLTSVLVVAIAEAGKRSAFLGAVLASLPLTSLLAFFWLYAETGDTRRIADLSAGIFWLVLPSLVLFVALPFLLKRGYPFGISLGLAGALTIAAYFVFVAVLKRFGISL